MDAELSRKKRLLIGLSLPVLLGLLAWYEAIDGRSIPCVFYEVTGLYCPGCGSGRAVYALLHGRLHDAVGYNVLLFILGPPSVLILLWEYCRLVFPCLKLRPAELSRPVILGCTLVIFLYWLLRNLPAFSFLAPG